MTVVSPSPIMRRVAKATVLPFGIWRRRGPGDLVILLYHRVGAGGREIDLPLDRFERQLGHLVEHAEAPTLDEWITDPRRGGVVLTFDDGYRDFHEHVVPLLVRYNVRALLYLATGLVEGESMTPPSEEAVTWAQLAEAASTGLVTVGAHTHHHADLSRATERQADEEMRRAKELIEDRLGTPCRHFAYPWAVGSTGADRAVRRLFSTAALHAWRTNRRGRTDPHRLGRVPVLRNDGPLFFGAKARGMLDGEGLAYRVAGRGPWGRP